MDRTFGTNNPFKNGKGREGCSFKMLKFGHCLLGKIRQAERKECNRIGQSKNARQVWEGSLGSR